MKQSINKRLPEALYSLMVEYQHIASLISGKNGHPYLMYIFVNAPIWCMPKPKLVCYREFSYISQVEYLGYFSYSIIDQTLEISQGKWLKVTDLTSLVA